MPRFQNVLWETTALYGPTISSVSSGNAQFQQLNCAREIRDDISGLKVRGGFGSYDHPKRGESHGLDVLNQRVVHFSCFWEAWV